MKLPKIILIGIIGLLVASFYLFRFKKIAELLKILTLSVNTGRLKEIFDEEDEFNIEEDGTVL